MQTSVQATGGGRVRNEGPRVHLRRSLLFVSASLVILAVWWGLGRDRSADPATELPHLENDMEIGDGDVEPAVHQHGDSNDALQITPETASIGARALAEAKRYPAGHPRQSELLQLLASCNNELLSMDAEQRWKAHPRYVAGESPFAREQRELFMQWMQVTRLACAGVDQSEVFSLIAEIRERQGEWLTPADPGFPEASVRDLNARDDRETVAREPEVAESLWEMVYSAQTQRLTGSALALLALADVGPFAEASRQISRLSNVPGPGSADERAIHVRLAAAEVFACRQQGGCGPGSLRTLFGDGPPISQLHWQLGVEGLYRETFSPQQWRIIESIVAELNRCTAERSCREG